MSFAPQIMSGSTTHARLGSTKHAFTYGVDFVLLDTTASKLPSLVSRNGFNLASVHDQDHGGEIAKCTGATWAKCVFTENGLELDGIQVLLLCQPRILGKAFNPVSFWLAMKDDALLAVIAEVNNTFGERHSYLCHLPDFEPIETFDTIQANKVFHVSPFQDVAGKYRFNFAFANGKITIRIRHDNSGNGVVATLTGTLRPLTNPRLLLALAKRPHMAWRTISLIHWQALRLFLKGVKYRPRPTPPSNEGSS